MKVLLINPPSDNIIKSEVPKSVREESGNIPPLGILYIYTVIKESGEFEVKIYDLKLKSYKDDEIYDLIKSYSPEVIGITTTTHNLVDSYRVSKIAKEVSRNIKVVVGGPHIDVFPEAVLSIPTFDFAIRGEGEYSFLKLLRRISKGEDYSDLKGLIYRNGKKIVVNPSAPPIVNLDELPFPDRRALPYEKYYNIMVSGRIITTLITSRGCPFKCSFCSTPHGACRMRSPENVVDEMEHIKYELGINFIDIMDDTFNLSSKRVIDICNEIIKRKLKIRFHIRARVRGTTSEVLEALKEAGCGRIQFGIETSSNEGMKVLNKGLTIQEVIDVFALTKKYKIETVAYFMIGCPHEKTEADIMRTVRFAKKLAPDYVMFNVFTPYPGTALYEEGLRRGIISEDYWLDFAKNPRPDFRPKAWSEHFSEEFLYKMLEKCYRKFYWRPAFILKELKKTATLKGFLKKFSAGIKMLPIFNRE